MEQELYSQQQRENNSYEFIWTILMQPVNDQWVIIYVSHDIRLQGNSVPRPIPLKRASHGYKLNAFKINETLT